MMCANLYATMQVVIMSACNLRALMHGDFPYWTFSILHA